MIALTSKTDPALSKLEIYAQAERIMRRGKRLVISGCLVATIGMVAYCALSLEADASQQPATTQFEALDRFTGATLGVVGVGTFLWLLGAWAYLRGGLDSDPSGPDLFF